MLQVQNFEGTAHFFRDHLKLPIQQEWHDVGNGILFNAGKATIEIVDAEQIADVDRIELGQTANTPIRLVLGVADVESASKAAQDGGAKVLNAIVDTDWGLRNQRLTMPDGIPIKALTLSQGKEDAS